MSRDLVNPLASILAQATRKLPAQTGETARAAARRHDVAILADVSGSMAEAVGARTKIELLREALDSVLPTLAAPRLIAFSYGAREVATAAHLPDPSGGTALHLALRHAGGLDCGAVLVISDGVPDSRSEALAEAARMRATIDVIYVGRDDDREAIEFMRELARRGRGRVVVHDLRRHAGSPALAGEMRRALALPAPRRS